MGGQVMQHTITMAVRGFWQPAPVRFQASCCQLCSIVTNFCCCLMEQALYGSMARVRTPGIYWQATQRRVLTMEWIDGVKLTNKVG